MTDSCNEMANDFGKDLTTLTSITPVRNAYNEQAKTIQTLLEQMGETPTSTFPPDMITLASKKLEPLCRSTDEEKRKLASKLATCAGKAVAYSNSLKSALDKYTTGDIENKKLTFMTGELAILGVEPVNFDTFSPSSTQLHDQAGRTQLLQCMGR